MTREAFIERWKRHLAGLALFGVASETRDSPLARAAKILDIPADVEKLLGRLYDDATRKDNENHRQGTTQGVPPKTAL